MGSTNRSHVWLSIPARARRSHSPYSTETVAAKICDFLPVAGVALPHDSATLPGATVETPIVSPGHTDVSPYWVETWNGADCHPPRIAYSPTNRLYPAGVLLVSHATYATPFGPPLTCMMCGTLSVSAGAWIGPLQCLPPSV